LWRLIETAASAAAAVAGVGHAPLMLRSRTRSVAAPASGPTPLDGVWHLDEDRSRVEFRVPYYWGLGTIRTRFTRFTATLGLHPEPWLELSADATTVTSGSARRDRQLRSPSFFGADAHPEVRFEAVTPGSRTERCAPRGCCRRAADGPRSRSRAAGARPGANTS